MESGGYDQNPILHPSGWGSFVAFAGLYDTWTNPEGEEMQTLFILEGTVQYIDDDDNLIYQDDVFSKLERYLKFCDEQGIEPQDLRY